MLPLPLFFPKITPMTIDYVIPMVFEDDALWQEDYKKFMHILRYKSNTNARYRSWNTEHLLIRCIRKFMPFIRNIYIILARESQKKPWMDEEGIKIVYHEDIIPKQYLPCFNSCTIEMFVPYIEGLSEYFIYGNDDMFPVSEMSEEDFFVNGLPVQHFDIKEFPEQRNIFHDKCKNQQNMVAGAFGKELGNTWLYNGHCLSPMLKSSCLEVRKRFEKKIAEDITPFRSETSYNQYLYVLWQYFTDKYVDGRVKSTYLSVKDHLECVERIMHNASGVVCVNDNECADDVSGISSLVIQLLNEKIMSDKKKIDYRVWVSYHRDELVNQYGLHDDEHHKLFATHKNVDGKNINHMNPVYSEMVTMWYVWKNNLKSDYVGFEHYRRHLDIRTMPKKGECQIFRAINFRNQTVYQQYAQCHNAKDMDVMLSLLDEKYGEGNNYSNHIRNSHVLIANCCFLMNWADFKKLCEFMFPLLDNFAAIFGISNTNVKELHDKAYKDFGGARVDYQTRILSFLAERLISAWIMTNMDWWNGIDVAIVHYNTPELTEAAIRSLNKHTVGCRVTVFDNSDERPFPHTFENVTIIDNTKGQVIDFDEMLSHYPDKQDDDRNKSNFGSAKHCKSVDVLMDYLPNGFILMDSDVLVTRDITKFVCNDAVSGMEHTKDGVTYLMPFICYLNVPVLKANGVSYFNGDKMWALSNVFPNNRYDTGAWVYEDVRNKQLSCKYIDIWQHVIHLGHGSWRGKKTEKWLEENKELYI